MTAKKTQATSKTKAKARTTTEILNSSSANAKRLKESVAQMATGSIIAGRGLTLAPGVSIDLEALANLMEMRLSRASKIDQVNGDVITTKTSAAETSEEPANPIDAELNSISDNLKTLSSEISDLFTELDPMLAYDYDDKTCDAEGRPADSRKSVSPLHSRLMDRNEQLEFEIARIRHLKSRIRN